MAAGTPGVQDLDAVQCCCRSHGQHVVESVNKTPASAKKHVGHLIDRCRSVLGIAGKLYFGALTTTSASCLDMCGYEAEACTMDVKERQDDFDVVILLLENHVPRLQIIITTYSTHFKCLSLHMVQYSVQLVAACVIRITFILH
jgi:hypothetical protein